jgi:cullin-associated NEDD8-dissociated protein 1
MLNMEEPRAEKQCVDAFPPNTTLTLLSADPAVQSLAVRNAFRPFIASAEFHTSSLNVPKGTGRKQTAQIESQGRPYRAVVVLFFNGGLDSWNVLAPHSGCGAHDLYADYAAQRGAAVAMSQAEMLQIDVAAGTQPCSKFGLNPSLTTVKQLYDAGDALLVANVGALVEPLTKQDVVNDGGGKTLPLGLFSHNIMQRNMHTVHAQIPSAQGVLGRLFDALAEQAAPFKNALYSIMGKVILLSTFSPF